MIKRITLLIFITSLMGISPAQATLPPAQVFIVAGSDINMVSRESKVPVSIQNNYDRPIRIRVHARATNAAVNVSDYVSLTVPANSRKDALIPISVLSSGSFTVKVWVTTFTNIRLGNTLDIKLTANPDVEFVILISFGLFVIALLALGTFRMVTRNRGKA